MAEPAIKLMTPDEFLAWQMHQDELYELVGGIPVPKAMTGATKRHDRVLVNAIAAFVSKLRGGPCRPMTDDITLVAPNANVRRPDLTIECGEIDGASMKAAEPVLVLEVLSPSTEDVDRFVKLEEYKGVPSMRHVLIAAAGRLHVVHYSRGQDGGWSAMSHIGAESIIDLPGLGCTLGLAELYEDVPLLPVPPGPAAAP